MRNKTRSRRFVHIFLLTSLICGFAHAASTQSYLVKWISNNDGLSQGTIECLFQDSLGFIWFCTQEGLNRYDAYDLSRYTHKTDTNSISENYTRKIIEDAQNNLWIGTLRGLNIYNPGSGRFTHLFNQSKVGNHWDNNTVKEILQDSQGEIWIGTKTGLDRVHHNRTSFARFSVCTGKALCQCNHDIEALLEDSLGSLWIGTHGDGLYRLDEKRTRFERYTHDISNPLGLPDNWITSLFEDKHGILWIGTPSGLCMYDPDKKTFENLFQSGHEQWDIHGVEAISEDDRGVLWIGCTNGLFVFDRITKTFSIPKTIAKAGEEDRIHNQYVKNLLVDRSSDLWVGTKKGAYRLEPKPDYFKHYKHDPSDPYSLSQESAFSILEDSNKDLWVGTYDGLNRLDHTTDRFTHFKHDENNPKSISSSNARILHMDRNNDLWIGTKGGGLNRFDRQTQTFEHFRYDPDNPQSLSGDNVVALAQDTDTSLWVGILEGGLNRFDIRSKIFYHYRNIPGDNTSLSHDKVFVLYKDRQENLWIGTVAGGLNRFDPETKGFIRYPIQPDHPEGLCHSFVLSILEDTSGVLWVGTSNGLAQLDRRTNTFRCFRQADGLPNNIIYGILQDDRDFLWLSTNLGLCKFNPKTHTVTQYTKEDGLQDNEFNATSYFKDSVGRLLFGGINGFNVFDPNKITIEDSAPPVIITGLRVLNQNSGNVGSATFHNGLRLRRHIHYVRKVVLDHTQNSFSLEFLSPDFRKAHRLRYAFKLSGLDEKWIGTDQKNHRATYNNVPPGEYVFHVKAFYHDGDFQNNQTNLKLIILAPWWSSWWVFSILLILLPVGFSLGVVLRKKHRKVSPKSLPITIEDLPRKKPLELLSGAAQKYGLTQTEIEILECLTRGLSNKEIAQERHVTLHTVKAHISQILSKLECTSRTQAALFAKTAMR